MNDRNPSVLSHYENLLHISFFSMCEQYLITDFRKDNCKKISLIFRILKRKSD